MPRLEGESFGSFKGEEACRERKRASEQVDGMKVGGHVQAGDPMHAADNMPRA